MKIKLDIQPRYQELEIHICNDADTEEVRETCKIIKAALDTCLMAHGNGQVFPLYGNDIIRIYSQSQKVYAATAKGTFRLHERLYELEEKLDGKRFLRISNSEIVNLRKIERLDTGLTGTIKMYLQENMETYVSRRYVGKIKSALGIGKEGTQC